MHAVDPKSRPASLVEALAGALRRTGDGTALWEAGCVLSGRDLLSRAEARRRVLAAQGLKPGARIYVRTGRRAAFWSDLLGVWALGATAIPIDGKSHPAREAQLFEKALPDHVVEEDAPDGAADDLHIEPGPDPAAILFTSGSTGAPKGVMLRGDALLGNARAALTAIDLRRSDRLFVATPFAFTSAICHFLAATLAGASLAATEVRLFKGDLHKAIRGANATCFGGAPLQAQWIAEACKTDRLPLRWIMSSGDHLRASVIEDLRAALPDTAVYTFYGLTETGGRLCMLPAEALPEAAGAVGKPVEGMAITIRDENGNPVPDGETGEVYATGDYLFDGYIGDLAETVAALTLQGLRTGDLGAIGPDGWLRLTGRADDVFKCAGQKVSAIPIADALMALGLFDDVAVVPRDHPAAGTVPWVAYVPKSKASVEPRAVGAALRGLLPANHMPQGFVELPAIPRTGSGKVRRIALKELVENAIAER
jgi:long-chain acyl-CoA synthetase